MNKLKKYLDYSPLSVLCNLAIVYVCYAICRVEFVLVNYSTFAPGLDSSAIWRMALGGFVFDSAAIMYTNLPYLLLVLLPLHWKETPVMRRVTKWVFVVVNALCLIINIGDSVYYGFTQRRTTIAVLDEFGGNTNILGIIGGECLSHWYLVILAAVMIWGLWRLYRPSLGRMPGEKIKRYYIRQGVTLLAMAPVVILGMRGHFFSTATRPVSMADAHQYVDDASHTAIVVNTPFAILRTSGRRQIDIPCFFEEEAQVLSLYNPVHQPSGNTRPDKKNVVVLMVESFSQEFVGVMNPGLDGGRFAGYTPFVDSLYAQCVTFDLSLANAWVSIDGVPVIMDGLPKLFNPFVLSPYSLNNVPGLPKMLGEWGYNTAFYHGAENSSLGLQAYTRSAGFDTYVGRDEYFADSRFGGRADYDGTWAIWDEEFLQYFCTKLGETPQPFLATLFTATSHHPYAIPAKYEDVFKTDDPAWPIRRCIRYTDHALGEFFRAAARQPWYANTLFIITADHACRKITREDFRNPLGEFRIPIMIFDPSGELAPGTRPGIAQQIDIVPTVLGYLGYDKPYVAYGKDLLSTPAEEMWAMNYQDFPQYVKGEWLIQLDSKYNLSGVYRYKDDPTLRHNLLPEGAYDKDAVRDMEMRLKAMLQTLDTRMKNNTLDKFQATNTAETTDK